MNKHNVVSLVLPTIEPITFKKYFLSSLHNLKEVAEYANICINFQHPWTSEEVESVVSEIKSYGFEVHYKLREQYHVPERGHVPFNRIRNDAAVLNEEKSLIYVLTDDDFSYCGPSPKSPSAGEQYLRAIYYMLRFKNCGCVLTGGSMYKYNPINHIGPTRYFNGEWFITGKSLFLKDMTDISGYRLFPEDSLSLLGAKEECLLCAARINKGLFPAKFGNARIRHDENRNHDEEILPGNEQFGWLTDDLIEANVNEYIRSHYGTNMRGVYSYEVVRPEVYKSNGGIDHERDRDKYLVDFSDVDIDTLKNYINKFVEEL